MINVKLAFVSFEDDDMLMIIREVFSLPDHFVSLYYGDKNVVVCWR